jgi:hypothetical protein
MKQHVVLTELQKHDQKKEVTPAVLHECVLFGPGYVLLKVSMKALQ